MQLAGIAILLFALDASCSLPAFPQGSEDAAVPCAMNSRTYQSGVSFTYNCVTYTCVSGTTFYIAGTFCPDADALDLAVDQDASTPDVHAGNATDVLVTTQDTSPGETSAVTFVSVSAGSDHTCGVKSDGTVACWGANTYGESSPPIGSFASVSAGEYSTCGVKADGIVACWGDGAPPVGTFVSISLSTAISYAGCGLKTDGTIACWGFPAPPTGTYISVAVAGCVWGVQACGVRTDGTVTCWGQDIEYGVQTPPAGTFVSVSAAMELTCGLRTDATITCWGPNAVTPPAGTFVSVGVGAGHVCGVRTDGTIACSDKGEAIGAFVSVGVGAGYACGVKSDGTIACWGDNTYGQATPPAM